MLHAAQPVIFVVGWELISRNNAARPTLAQRMRYNSRQKGIVLEPEPAVFTTVSTHKQSRVVTAGNHHLPGDGYLNYYSLGVTQFSQMGYNYEYEPAQM